MLIRSAFLLALAGLGEPPRRLGYFRPPRPVSNSTYLNERDVGCNGGGAPQIDCEGTCIPTSFDCCRASDGPYCMGLCDLLNGGCKDTYTGGGSSGGSGGGYGGGDEVYECDDGYSVCADMYIPPEATCCNDGSYCKLGKCVSDGTCDLGDDKTKEAGSGSGSSTKGNDETKTAKNGSASTGSSKGSDDDESESKETANSGNDKDTDDDKNSDGDKDTDEKAESSDGDKGSDASLCLPTLAVGLVALAPLLL